MSSPTFDASIGHARRPYEMRSSNPRDSQTGYHVYPVGKVAIPIVNDGQNREVIEAVERDCDYEGFIAVARPA
jgi:hypothetical protein